MRRAPSSFLGVVVLALGLPVGLIAVVPVNTGFLSPDTAYDINTNPGEQFFPAVDGTLATYHEAKDSGWRIGYYNFETGDTDFIPYPSGHHVSDYWAQPRGGRIAFVREEFEATTYSYAILVYDTNSRAMTEVRRHGPIPYGGGSFVSYPAIGANTVAFVESWDDPGELYVTNLSDLGSNATRLTYDTPADPRHEFSPSISASGDVIVWVSCPPGDLQNCDIEKAKLSGGAWTVSRITSAARFDNLWVRTDGSWIVYSRYNVTDPLFADVCWRPVAGGTEECLELPGQDIAPTIAGGVIIFSRFVETSRDVFAYQLGTNRLFQITSTPFNETLSDVAVLPGGSVRIVWDSGNHGQSNVYGADYSLPRIDTYTFGGFLQPVDSYPAFNVMKAGAAVPVRFSLGGFRGIDIFAAGFPKSAPTACGSSSLEAPVEETVTAGNSGLGYDASSDTYTYVWKTDRAWTGSCRQLAIRFTDQSTHYANFKFK